MTRWAGVPEDRRQAVLFAERLDDAVPAEHSVRFLDELLGRPEIDWKPWEVRYHRTLGQPAVHPRVPASILLYGLMTRIRSSRGLEDALRVRLDFRWLAHGHRLDHTMLSEFRRKHSSELKSLFVDVLLLAKELGLSHFQRIGFDGTRTRANNRRSGTRTPAELLAEQQKLQQEVDEFLQQAESADARDEELFGRDAFADMPQELRDKQRRAEKIGEALADLARLKEAGGKAPKRIPTTDLDARVMPNKDGGCAPNYTPLATVDIATGLIVADDVRSEINEDGQLIPQVEQVERDLDVKVQEVLTDGLNGTGANLAACAERGISLISPCALPDPANPALRDDPQQPVPETEWDKLPTHTTTFDGQKCTQLDKSAFVYDEERDCYWCPLGQPLNYANTTSEKNGSGRRIRDRYQADAATCAACPLRDRCMPGKKDSPHDTKNGQKNDPKKNKPRGRSISREQHERHRERHAQKMATKEAQDIYALRRHPGERPFAMIKHHFGLRRFLLRGLDAVRDEWRWAALAFNLQRLMSLLRSRAGPEPNLTAPSTLALG
jgi:transposase